VTNDPKTLNQMMNLTDAFVKHLETNVFPVYFNTCRWFAGKARSQNTFHVRHRLPVGEAYILVVETTYHDGPSEFYQLPLTQVPAKVEIPDKGVLEKTAEGQIIDAIYDEAFRQNLYAQIYQSPSSQDATPFATQRGKALDDADTPDSITSRVLPVDSSNSAMLFGGKYFMKLYRKLFDQTNPEVEMVSFLTQHSQFRNLPAFAGSITWQRDGQPDVTLGMMQQAIKADKDNWSLTGDFLNDFMYGVPGGTFGINEAVFDQVALLGQRTGEMHLGLYSTTADAAFVAEPFDDTYRQFLLHRLTDLLDPRSVWRGFLWKHAN
jgi:maltokinase